MVKQRHLTNQNTAAPEIFLLKTFGKEKKKKSQHEFYHIVTINSSLILN